MPIPSPGLLGRPSSLHAVLSRCLRAEVVKERVLLLPLRRGGGGGAKGRELEEDGSKAGSKLFCLGGLPYGMSACQDPGIVDVSVFVSFRLPRPRRVGKGGGCLGLETERWTCDRGECLFGRVLGNCGCGEGGFTGFTVVDGLRGRGGGCLPDSVIVDPELVRRSACGLGGRAGECL